MVTNLQLDGGTAASNDISVDCCSLCSVLHKSVTIGMDDEHINPDN